MPIRIHHKKKINVESTQGEKMEIRAALKILIARGEEKVETEAFQRPLECCDPSALL